MACQNVGAWAGSFIEVLSSRHSATSGRRVIRARLVFWRSGASGVGASAVHKKSTFFGVVKISVHPCEPPFRASTTRTCCNAC